MPAAVVGNPIVASRGSVSSVGQVQASVPVVDSPTGVKSTSESQPFDSSDVVVVACGPEPLIDNARFVSLQHGFTFRSELFNF